MLSEKNRKKIHEGDVFKHEVELSWLPSYKRDEPYWSNNWIFVPRFHEDGSIYMVDTFFHDFAVELTDENIDGFEFLFNKNNVKSVNPDEFFDYYEKDRFHVPLGSEGWKFCKTYLVNKDAVKNYESELERLESKLSSAKWEVERLEREIQEVCSKIQQ